MGNGEYIQMKRILLELGEGLEAGRATRSITLEGSLRVDR